ncbi:MAG: phenylalanine--tRNA ligase subunit alpha [Calditrichia bacterium]
MGRNISKIKDELSADLKQIKNRQDFESVRVKYLGKKGLLQGLFRQMKDVDPQERPAFGKDINDLKAFAEKQLDELKPRFEIKKKDASLDTTLPGRKPPLGRRHPLTRTLDDVKRFFRSMGFTVAVGPDVESDIYNFEALNIPKNHPARDMQDTIYLNPELMLRTHTSPVQIRTMLKQKPPVRIIAPGRVYRRDTPDASHSPFFHQVEGLCVDTDVSFGDLKAVIAQLARYLFGADIQVRFRPSFFPFTEPSMEYDFNCVLCRGKGCRVCKNTGWVEISGAGMVHPNVFKAVNYDPDKYTGYAFGMGVDRIAMMRHSIDDIRLFFENDLRFLQQF